MKNKESIFVIIFLILLVCGIGGFILYQNRNQKPQVIGNEYTPEQEISDEQIRQTIITLYYRNKDTGELMPEARRIDVGNLAKDPYGYLVNCLKEGPKSEKLEKVLPEGTTLKKTELKGNVLELDFSKEFVENAKEGKEEEKKIVISVVKTLTELKEVTGVRILIEGEANKAFKDSAVTFKEVFYRED